MFQFLGELIGSALMVIFGWAALFKTDRLARSLYSKSELHQGRRLLKALGVMLLLLGGGGLVSSFIVLFKAIQHRMVE